MNPSYYLTWRLCRLLFASYFRWRVFHPERVPLTGPVILAANHQSYLDPPLVGSGITRDINYLARENLVKYPVFGAYMRSLNVVPVDRDGGGAAGLKGILDRLLAGGGIILFPEGTRSRDGLLQPARAGVGLTIIKSAAPVVPVRVWGTFDAWSRQARIPRPHPVAVKYGHALMFEKKRAEAKSCSKPRLKEIYQEIAEELMRRIARMEPCEDKTTFP